MNSIKPLSPVAESIIPLSLLEKLRKGDVYAFVGSGLSIPAGFPSWSKLIADIYNIIKENLWKKDSQTQAWLERNFSSRPDWTAEILKTTPGDFYAKALKDTFKAKTDIPVSIPHALLSIIPFKGYLTTNYDSLIEDYLSIFQINEPHVWNYNEILKNPNFRSDEELNVFKIHGCAKKDIDSLILASSDYYKLVNDQRYVRFLDGIFSKNSILTIGFSLNDRDFRAFVEERYNLYNSNCAPMYSIIGSNQTCPLEIEVYANKYNIHLVPISSDNNYEELTSLLLSLFCLTHQVDSRTAGPSVNNLLYFRLHQTGKFNIQIHEKPNDAVLRATRLLSVFQEPIEMDLFTTICIDYKIELSPAHLKAIFAVDRRNISIQQKVKPSDEDIQFVAAWLSNYLDAVPLDSSGRYLTIYRKKFLSEFSKTIFYLLSNKIGWETLIGYSDKSNAKLSRINEFYKQEGEWLNWISVCDSVEQFIDQNTDQYIELIKTKFWVYFWTRRFDDAKKLLIKFPNLDEPSREDNYRARLDYMKPNAIKKLIKSFESRGNLGQFSLSLLGRSYARLSLKTKSYKERQSLLKKAKENLISALALAKDDNDMVEVAVQSWYLAVVCADLSDFNASNEYFSEVRRLDESIMNRIPGKAWLKVAEYRMYLKNATPDKNETMRLKSKAETAMEKLGMLDPVDYIDNEYYY